MTVPPARRIGLLRFALAIAATAISWLGVLPALSRLPPIREHIQRNQRQGIDPSAMFYTEVGRVSGVRVRYDAGRPTVSRIRIGDDW